jgi:hypothetical protein
MTAFEVLCVYLAVTSESGEEGRRHDKTVRAVEKKGLATTNGGAAATPPGTNKKWLMVREGGKAEGDVVSEKREEAGVWSSATGMSDATCLGLAASELLAESC